MGLNVSALWAVGVHMDSPEIYPAWIFGEPGKGIASHGSLRAVGRGLYVGSAQVVLSPDIAIVQLAIECPVLHDRANVLRFLLLDGFAIDPTILRCIQRFSERCRPITGVLVQCFAGASRSAAVAYMLLRVQDGLAHEEALARVSFPGFAPHPHTLASVRAYVEGRPCPM